MPPENRHDAILENHAGHYTGCAAANNFLQAGGLAQLHEKR
jgi:hypothetical protein